MTSSRSRRGALGTLSRNHAAAPIAFATAAVYLFTLAPAYARASERALDGTTTVARAHPTPATPARKPGVNLANVPLVDRPEAATTTQGVSSAATGGGGDGVVGSEVTAQSISLPSGPATIQGLNESLNVNLSTGTASLTIPIALPHARGDAQPSLALAYSSGGGRGVAGMGWDFGDAAITRQFSHGMPSYDDPGPADGWLPTEDRFVFGTDELVPVCLVTGTSCTAVSSQESFPAWADGWLYFRPGVETKFLRYFWSPDRMTWRAQAKSGVVMEFGRPRVGPLAAGGEAAAMETDPNHGTHIARWFLSREFDSADTQSPGSGESPVNIVVYRYGSDGGASYLQDVYDTPPMGDDGTASTNAYAHHIHMSYEQRTDPLLSFADGWQTTEALRLNRVDITAAGASGRSRQLLRRYELAYDSTSHTSLLTSIQLEGRCAPSNQSQITEQAGTGLLPWPTGCATLPATTFSYSHVTDSAGNRVPSPTGFEGFEGFNTTLQAVGASPPYSYGDAYTEPYDVNGDGLPDVLVTAPSLFGGDHGVYLNGQGGSIAFGPALHMGMAATTDSSVSAVTTSSLTFEGPEVAPLDVDGDGVVDMLHMPVSNVYTVFTPVVAGGIIEWSGRSVTVPLSQVPKVDFVHWGSDARVMDVNGDGLVDIVHLTGTQVETYLALGRYPGGDGQFGSAVWTGPESATLSVEPLTACPPWSGGAVSFGDADTTVADMNGDGLPDIVRVRNQDIRYWPGRGQGLWGTGTPESCPANALGEDRSLAMAGGPPMVNSGNPFQLDDVNGDGLADLIQPLYGAVQIWLNVDGTSWTSPFVIDGAFSSQINNEFRLLDINGSGTKDLVWGTGGKYQYIDVLGGQRPWLLTGVTNGLGRSSAIGYTPSTQLMLASQATAPWTSVMPLVMPVVTSVVDSDGLSTGALGTGRYETDYTYRNPYYDGQRREFGGFQSTTVTHIGDSFEPTAIERSTFLQGQCIDNPSDGYDACAPAERWRDNPRLPLAGLTQVKTVADATGVTYSTGHSTYTLDVLYRGADGRGVRRAYDSSHDAWTFETSPFTANGARVSVVDLVDNTEGGATSTSTLALPSASFAHVGGQRADDAFGNTVQVADSGCLDGSGCSAVDEAITHVAVFQTVTGDLTGWQWRPAEQYVVGSSAPTSPRDDQLFSYDTAGRLQQRSARLQGTLGVSRFFSSGSGAVAPTPTTASSDGTIMLSTLSHDVYGNITSNDAAGGHCRSVQYDPAFAMLPTAETIFAGPVAGACGTRALTVHGTYDAGLEKVTALTGVNGEQTAVVYDGFGRVTQTYLPDPVALGAPSSLASVSVDYALPGQSPDPSYSITHTQVQDGPDPTVAAYKDTWVFVDGFGRIRLQIETGDVAGAFVVSGFTSVGARGVPFRNYQPWFWSGSPASFSLRSAAPATAYAEQTFDAMGRKSLQYSLDGLPFSQWFYHPMAVDVWDAEAMNVGPHHGAFSTATTDGHGRLTSRIERVHQGATLESRITSYRYLPTGETTSITRSRGSDSVVRWMVYDSIGRLQVNADPDATVAFTPAPPADISQIRTQRYAYDDAGQLVATSDARGCGENRYYDGAGRLTGEDYSPCQSDQAAYSAPNFTTGWGLEAQYSYDQADPVAATAQDSDAHALPGASGPYLGYLASALDRGQKTIIGYDGRGRAIGFAKQIAIPGAPVDDPTARYAPRWYVKAKTFDAAGRVTAETTGSTVSELAGASGQSVVQTHFSPRGGVSGVGSSYGTLVSSVTRTPEGLPTQTAFSDAASTMRTRSYDSDLRLQNVTTYRGSAALWSAASGSYTPPTSTGAPALQLLLEDTQFAYDRVGNPTVITDWRTPSEWPTGAQPVTRNIAYDDAYHVTQVSYSYPDGTDAWTPPFAAEDAQPALEQPVPQVSFSNRVLSENYTYDWLGNTIATDDDSHGFYDRSLGTIQNGTPTSGPYQIQSASNKSFGGDADGQLGASYDAAGNLVSLMVVRNGVCVPAAASCTQQFTYSWDERGRLSSAKRWDLPAGTLPTLGQPSPTSAPVAELDYAYDATGERVRKTATDAQGNQLHDAFVFASLELRRATWSADYELDDTTDTVYLDAAGQRVARVFYSQEDLPALSSGQQHVFLLLGGNLGSTEAVIDYATGELVEHGTYAAYGSGETDYRPSRWGNNRERYRFTGKEDDIEVGLTYFGHRYYNSALGRWMSPDPVALHGVRGDLNLYSYTNGRTFFATDPDGMFIPLLVILAAVVVSAVVAGTANVLTQTSHGASLDTFDWESFLIDTTVGALAGGVGAVTGGAATPRGCPGPC